MRGSVSQKKVILGKEVIINFINEKFYALNDRELIKFYERYRSIHGEKAARFLENAYPFWKSYRARLSGERLAGIHACLMKCLDDNDRFQLLRLHVPEVEAYYQKKFNHESHEYLNDIDRHFQCYVNLMKHDDGYSFSWYMRRAFTAGQLSEFTRILKHKILKKAAVSYSLVCADVLLINEYIGKLEADVACDMSYTIRAMDHAIRTRKNAFALPFILEPADFQIPEFKSRYENHLLAYFAEHDMEEVCDSLTDEVDIRTYFGNINHIIGLFRSDKDQESAMSFKLPLKGGELKLRLEPQKPQSQINSKLTRVTIKAAIIIAVGLIAAGAPWPNYPLISCIAILALVCFSYRKYSRARKDGT